LPKRRKKPSALWIAGSVVLALTATAQAAYFYRDELAAAPMLRPYTLQACEHIGCALRSPYDVGRIELVQPTGIAPHPRLANVLRLRATLVNRAEKAQPLPWLQVSLSDSTGRVLSRRTFAPRDYLEQAAQAATDMAPNLAVGALLDVTNPDNKAAGYEIEFVVPPTQ